MNMKPRQAIEAFNKVLELFDDMTEDPTISQYYIDKVEVLVEEIETLLGQSEVEE